MARFFDIKSFSFVEMGKVLRWSGTSGEEAMRSRETSLAQWRISEQYRNTEEDYLWEQGDGNGQPMNKAKPGKVDIVTSFSWKVLQIAPANSILKRNGKELNINICNVRLSDSMIMPVLAALSKARCVKKFPHDFESAQRLKTTRLPVDDPPVVGLLGLHWFVRVAGRLLCGEEFRGAFGWDVAKKERDGPLKLYIGEYVACPRAVNAAMAVGAYYKMIDFTTQYDVYVCPFISDERTNWLHPNQPVT